MVEPYIALGSALFWLLTAVSALFVVGFLSFHRTGKAVTTVIAYLAIVALFTNADLVGYVKANWLTLVTYLAGYIAIGTLYMVFRWRMLSAQVAGIYEDIRAEFLETNKLTEIVSATDKDRLKSQASNDYRLRKLDVKIPMLVRENKARLTTWLTFWFFSAIEYVLGDLLVNIVNGIVRNFSGLMQNITNRQFSKFSELN